MALTQGGFDVYLPAVDDRAIDLIVRIDTDPAQFAETQQVFDAYYDWFYNWIGRRKSNLTPMSWKHSPISRIKDFSRFKGLRMVDIPAEHQLPNVDPALIDRLQVIWVTPMRPLTRVNQLRDIFNEQTQDPSERPN